MVRRCLLEQYGRHCSAFIYRVDKNSEEIGVVFYETFLLRSVQLGEADVLLLAIAPCSARYLFNECKIVGVEYGYNAYDAMILRQITRRRRLSAQLSFLGQNGD